MIYKDDLFLGLYGKSQNKQASGELDEIKVDIAAYLDKHISISFGDQLVKWQQFEVHADPEAIWITLTSEMMKNMFKSFTIRNNVLQEHYSDQKNIIHLTSGTKKKDILFERNDKPKLVTF
jgi:hypothetical protein